MVDENKANILNVLKDLGVGEAESKEDLKELVKLLREGDDVILN